MDRGVEQFVPVAAVLAQREGEQQEQPRFVGRHAAREYRARVLALHAALTDLADAAAALGEKCLSGMSWNRGTVRNHLDGSLAERVTRAARVGYDQA